MRAWRVLPALLLSSFALQGVVAAAPLVHAHPPAATRALPVVRPPQPAQRLLFNGAELAGALPLRQANTLYLPVWLAESLGAEVHLQPAAKAAVVVTAGRLINLSDGKVATGRSTPPLPQPALWREGMLMVPARFFEQLGARVSAQGKDVQVEGTPLAIDQPGFRFDPDKLQVILPLPRQTGVSVQQDPSGHVILGVNGAAWAGGEVPTLLAGDDRLLLAAAAAQAGGVAQVRLQLRYPAPLTTYWLEHPTRLVLEVPRAFSYGRTERDHAGLYYTHLLRGTPDRQVNFQLLRVSLAEPQLQVRPAVTMEANGAKVRTRLAPVSALAQQQGALAAINASFFSNKTEEPLGLLLVDRQLITPPLFNRTGLGLTADGHAVIRRSNELVPVTVLVDGRDGRNSDSINEQKPPDGITIYSPAFGPRTPVPQSGRETPSEFAIGPDGSVVQQGNAPLAIPAGGYVLSGRGAGGRWLRDYVRGDRKVALVVDMAGRSEFADAVGGGPRLLQDGLAHITGPEELFKDDILKGRAPRTAVGIPAGGRELIILVADGRVVAAALPGLTLEDAAALLQEAGARDALNFDGGGSTTLYLNQQVRNRPSDGHERKVSGALLIVPSTSNASRATP